MRITALLLLLFGAWLSACGGETTQGGPGSRRDTGVTDTSEGDADVADAPEAADATKLDGEDGALEVTDAIPPRDGDAAADVVASTPVLCRPCTSDEDCVEAAGAACVDFGSGGAFCGQACVEPGDCPGGYACADVTSVSGGAASQCVPIDGVCDCVQAFVAGGYTTRCVVANDFGLCEGTRACTEEGLGPCDAPTPEPDEDCDGLDEDCDGETDEGFPGAASSCGQGACVAAGVVICVDGVELDDCSPGPPMDEACDGIDDDCDGATDEDLVAGAPCAQQLGICEGAAGVCVGGAWICDDGVYATHSVAWEAVEATCDGLDNDCDGVTDEYLPAQETACGIGACAALGSATCQGGAWVDDCIPAPAAEADATCDGLDDDCDGATDEEHAPPVTACGAGACAASGARLCQGGQEVDTCAPGTPGVEACNGIDDDCDDATDEGALDGEALACALESGGAGVCVGGACVEPCAGEQDWPDAAFEDTNCDGIDGDVARAVFVAPAQHGGDDFNPGTPELPMLTIQAAIGVAAGDPARSTVLVSAGAYEGPITLAPGVGVHGGYHKPMGWARDEAYTVTVAVPAGVGGAHQVGVYAHDLPEGQATVLDRLTIQIGAIPQAGGSNYGIHAQGASGLVLRDLTLDIGAGGAGQPGQGAGQGAPTNGKSGGGGYAACVNDSGSQCSTCPQPPAGSAGAALTCAYGVSSGAGGEGALGGTSYLAWGESGQSGQSPGGVPGGGGVGGSGASALNGSTAQGGAIGDPGAPGTGGAGGVGFGRFEAGYYVPAAGVTGTSGEPGRGGGGGGGGLGCEKTGGIWPLEWSCDIYGGSGGGGGSGGCGGEGGAPGDGGGAVFGVLLVDATAQLEGVSVSVSPGGVGGSGQAGGDGSPGGTGGNSGSYYGTASAGKGGGGGGGGKGGSGGHGGGGGGGPSYCVYVLDTVASESPPTPAVGTYTCEGAQGGDGGGSSWHPGAVGAAGEIGVCGAACLDEG
jgi:hypothetical protein